MPDNFPHLLRTKVVLLKDIRKQPNLADLPVDGNRNKLC